GTLLAGYFTVAAAIGVPPGERGSGGLFPVERPSLAAATFVTAWALVVLIAAELSRMRRQRAAEAARIRAEQERRQASEERLRMARELHDVLAHNISMINVQAGVALHLIDENPGQARTALAAIKDASKDALTEMRGVIGALRAEGETAPPLPHGGARPAGGAAGPRPVRRAAGRDRDDRGAAAAGHRHRPRRVPHHPGVADERDPPRRARPGDGAARHRLP